MTKDDSTGKGQNTTNSADPVAFLRDFDPDGRFNLVAIDPETAYVTGRTFAPRSWDEMRAWVAERNGQQNLYFTVNEPHPTAPNKKLEKGDIAALRAVYVDADPRKDQPFDDERRRLLDLAKATQSSPCPPTFVVDSGGGVQFFWRLAEKLPASEHRQWAEEQGRGLAHAVGGDAVQNIDRIMRLPGTVNIPDAKKRARGRTEAGARLVAANSATYIPDDLSSYAAPRSPDSDNMDSAEAIAAIQRTLDMQAIAAGPDQHLLSRLSKAADADPRLRAILDGKPLKGDDQSGSAYRAALVARLCENGTFTPTEYAAVATSLDCCNTNKEVPGGWPRQFAREWCNIGMKHAVERWFDPIPEIELNPFEVQHTKQTEQQKGGKFQFVTLTEAAGQALTDASQPLIKGLLDQGAMSVLYGDSNAGKTFVALDITYCIADGRPYANMKTSKCHVVYIVAEGGRSFKKRAKAVLDDKGYANGDNVHLLLSPVDLLDPEADLAHLVADVRALQCDVGLVVLDTLSRALSGGDENSSVDMGAFVRNLDRLRQALRAHVMVIHHTGKDKAKGARGHSLLRAATDTEIEVDNNVISVTKQRDLDKNWSSPFRLRSVQIGFDAERDPVSSMVVDLVPPESVAPVKQVLTETQEGVLAALREACAGRRDGVKAAAVAFRCGMSDDTARKHLEALDNLSLVQKVKRAMWMPREPLEIGNSVSFQQRGQAVQTEKSGTRAGKSVFE